MPTTTNMTGGGAQLGPILVRSVTFFSYPSVKDQTAEVSPAAAKYFVGHFFSGTNGGGTDLGAFSVDISEVIFTHYGRANIQDTLVEIFGYRGPDI